MLSEFIINNMYETPWIVTWSDNSSKTTFSAKAKVSVYDSLKELRLAIAKDITNDIPFALSTVRNVLNDLVASGIVKVHSIVIVKKATVRTYKIKHEIINDKTPLKNRV